MCDAFFLHPVLPQVVEILARGVSLSWSAPPRPEGAAGGEGDGDAKAKAKPKGDGAEAEAEAEAEGEVEGDGDGGEAQEDEGGEQTPPDPPFTYEVSVSYSGKDGRYKSAFR